MVGAKVMRPRFFSVARSSEMVVMICMAYNAFNAEVAETQRSQRGTIDKMMLG